MNENILALPVQSYIDAHLKADVHQIALAKSPFEHVSPGELAGQIIAKKKAEKKLPSWFKSKDIYYPAPLSIEQTSSELTARYKAKLVKGETLIDLTGGFGVDAYYFSKSVKHVTHCEINADLSQIAQHNAKVFGSENIHFIPADGIAYLLNGHQIFDQVYIDPARRAEKGKVFMLKDCTPDVVTHLDKLLEKTRRILIKTAPLLDITAGLTELRHVKEIHIISVKNECKELLWIIERDFEGKPEIIAVTLNDTEKRLSIDLSSNDKVQLTPSLKIGAYLYEPDVALLKSGAFNFIGQAFGLEKLHLQTHLYTSPEVVSTFPGRIFLIEEIITTKALKKIKNWEGNVIVRNYPARADDLIKKYKIKPSDRRFLIFTKTANDQHVVLKADIIQYY